ncbi:hypothetical protein Tco_0111861 [Tanacetum coccineum]
MPVATFRLRERGASNGLVCLTVQRGVEYCSASTRSCSSIGAEKSSTRQCAIMRRLVECNKTKLPLDPAISLVEYLK